ncbi:MAG: SusD/RagB family nutrient-binding outer membrane lipoprotein [Tannerellaceae bacterium]|nr:SusD/RagB family nutrient-binding outer membrane lipoprotein [Tannerellaceae bacterium]
MKSLVRMMSGTVLFLLCGCVEEGNLRESPVNPRSAHPSQLLTQVIWEAFRAFQGTTPLYASRMLVLTDTESVHQYYKWSHGEFAFEALRNVQKMQEESLRFGEAVYMALAHFFRAYYFLHTTLSFGDIPYKEALRGEIDGIDRPVYDTQKEVFAGILAELEEADRILTEIPDADLQGDIIYNGDTNKWRRLINAFRLKTLLMLSLRVTDACPDVPACFAAIATSAPLLRSPDDNGQLVFLDRTGNRYPEFNASRYNSGIYVDSTFVRLLQDHEDPRLFVFCAPTKAAREAGKEVDDFSAYEGGDPAAPYDLVNAKAAQGRVSKVNDRYYLNPTAEPLLILGFAEQQFILAEAAVRGWIKGDAANLYASGIHAAFRFYATYASGQADYLGEEATDDYLLHPLHKFESIPSEEGRIEAIIIQKYFQSFLQGKWTPFFDHLRTGYPVFRCPDGVNVPCRWIYPLTEYQTNAENLSAALLRQFVGVDEIHRPTWLWHP